MVSGWTVSANIGQVFHMKKKKTVSSELKFKNPNECIRIVPSHGYLIQA